MFEQKLSETCKIKYEYASANYVRYVISLFNRWDWYDSPQFMSRVINGNQGKYFKIDSNYKIYI